MRVLRPGGALLRFFGADGPDDLRYTKSFIEDEANLRRELRGRGGGLFFPLPPAGGAGLTSGRPLLPLGFLLRVLRRLRAIDQLEEHHGRAVAGTRAGLDDPGVAAVPVGESRGDRVEEPAHHLGVGNHRQDLAARVEALALGQGDHVVREAAHRLRLRLGRGHALMPEQRDEKVAEQRPAVLRDAAELVAVVAVPHRTAPPRPRAPRTFGSIRMPSDKPSAASAVLISSIDFSPRFFTCSRSASFFWTRSTTRFSSAFFSALMARAGSASSSSVLARASRRNASPLSPSASSSSRGTPAASG